MKKARAIAAVFSHPFHTDSISGIEVMYTETLQAIGDKGHIAGSYYIDLDRQRHGGLYTCTFRLSIRIDRDSVLDLGKIESVKILGNELRFDLLDGSFPHSIVLTVEG